MADSFAQLIENVGGGMIECVEDFEALKIFAEYEPTIGQQQNIIKEIEDLRDNIEDTDEPIDSA